MPGDRSLSGRTILAIFAHPDDESIACGGTLARAASAGARVVLICATRGEKGSVSDPALVADGDLGRARVAELRTAAEALGISDLIVCRHPDGDVRWADVPELHGEIVVALRRFRPDAVITFGEDGLYWHLDHIGVHERTYTALRSLGTEAPPLYYVTMPKGAIRAMVDEARAKGGAPDASFWGIEPDAFGDSAQPCTLVVDVRPWAEAKLAALRCHRTQLGVRNPIAWVDVAGMRRWLGAEHFRRAATVAGGPSVLEWLGDPMPASSSEEAR
ncbi:MAG TPA: PIG-L deacetylase family protein [Vicinamibacterales bacterium]|nr:PIG-L deacetylase family protein [Vicinamibacterales bacterium]